MSIAITLQGVSNNLEQAQRELNKGGLPMMHHMHTPSNNSHVLLQYAIRYAMDTDTLPMSVVCSTTVEAEVCGGKRRAEVAIEQKAAYCILAAIETPAVAPTTKA
jgi:hypothetical protein